MQQHVSKRKQRFRSRARLKRIHRTRIREIRYEILNTLLEAHSKQEEFDTNRIEDATVLVREEIIKQIKFF